VGPWRARNWVSDVSESEAEDETFGRAKRAASRGCGCTIPPRLGYFLNFPRVGTAPPRWPLHARFNPSGKNVSANAEMPGRKKNTLAIGRHDAHAGGSRRKKGPRDSRVNSPDATVSPLKGVVVGEGRGNLAKSAVKKVRFLLYPRLR